MPAGCRISHVLTRRHHMPLRCACLLHGFPPQPPHIHTHIHRQTEANERYDIFTQHTHPHHHTKETRTWCGQTATCSKEARNRHSVCKKQDRTKRRRCKMTSRQTIAARSRQRQHSIDALVSDALVSTQPCVNVYVCAVVSTQTHYLTGTQPHYRLPIDALVSTQPHYRLPTIQNRERARDRRRRGETIDLGLKLMHCSHAAMHEKYRPCVLVYPTRLCACVCVHKDACARVHVWAYERVFEARKS